MPARPMLHETDPRDDLFNEIGDLSSFEVLHNQVLVAIYKRPEGTRSGIILTDQSRDEDRHQGKVGLIVKAGPSAFTDPSGRWQFPDLAVGDWVFFRVSDGWNMSVNQVDCRMVSDTQIRGRIQ